MCQICRIGQRYSLSPASLLDTHQFSHLVITDYRQGLRPTSAQIQQIEKSKQAKSKPQRQKGYRYRSKPNPADRFEDDQGSLTAAI